MESRIEVAASAMGSESGWAALDLRDASVGTRVIPRADEFDGAVAMVTLGGLMAAHHLERVDVLKLDCEGAEFDILLGAPTDLLERVELVIGEYHRFGGRDPKALRDRLEAAGYSFSSEPHPREPLLGLFTAVRQAKGERADSSA